jgi:hypothetical protein
MVITSSSCWSKTQQIRLNTLVNFERETPQLPGQFWASANNASEPGLFDLPADDNTSATTSESDATSRPIEGSGPGYAAALSEAATL